jgi:uncharacterized protein (DUF885 family)
MARIAIWTSAILAVVALLAAGAGAADPAADRFRAFVDDYYTALFRWDPAQATAAGIHDCDDQLSDLSAAAFSRRGKSLHEMQDRLKTIRSEKLSADDAIDAEVLDYAIQAELLEIDAVRGWQRDPVTYLGVPAGAIDITIKRTFAPLAQRLRSVIGRLKATPPIIAAAKANIVNPPKEFTDLGIIVAAGSADFFRDTLPAWAKTAAGDDAKLLQEFEAANQSAIAAFDDAQRWLTTDLLPRSTGSYAIGRDAFLKKLQLEEMLDIPLDKLLAIGEANLQRDRDAFIATAARIDGVRPPQMVLDRLTQDYPKPDQLVPATRDTLERVRTFLIDKKIVTVPSEVRPTVLETPAFQRTGSFASMDTPGPYETKAKEAFYYVTPPEKNWDAKRQDEHMRQFNKTGLDVTTIHEAFPGHYIQFLFAPRYPTKVRKLYSCGTNAEGWAHYTEQMMIEEGYGHHDPKMRLAQLSLALLRDCRYIVGIKLHTEGMTVEQGTDYFVTQGFIERETAFQETRRGTYNPTYLYYTLGKLQIYKLRSDYQKAKGAEFRLQTFHDDFVKQGSLPIKLIRRILLPGDTGPTL